MSAGWAIVEIAVPFVGALVGVAIGRRARDLVAPVALAATGIPLLISAVIAVLDVRGPTPARTLHVATMPSGSVSIGIDFRLDGLAAMVGLAVTLVAFLVQLYSIAYLRGDPRYSSYAAFVSLFTAAMLLVVNADDLIVLLVGWEVMGVCSYFLIGHHWELPEARAAAVKAFITTRVGDVPFLFGIFTLGLAAGSFRIGDVTAAAAGGRLDATTLTVATLLLLAGVCGKSAQFPLHTWLPDAMAGPTPVSALIHAATMVAAGIFVVARLYDVFLAAPATLAVMAVIASVTMLGAALFALAQDDIKRVLAWSTVSQLAYMLGGLAVGSYEAAGFHLLTHAAFKALLFLCAGAVIHAVGTNSMTLMGGLRRSMPLTFVTMTLGLAALAGLPPFAGFFSKEAILGAAEVTASGETAAYGWTGWLVLVVGLLTVAVTAAYVTRLWVMTFFHDRRGADAATAVHDAPALMRWPLVVLAVPTVVLGAAGLRAGWLPRWLDNRDGRVLVVSGATDPFTRDPFHLGVGTILASSALLGVGAAAAWFGWRRDRTADPAVALGRFRPVLAKGFGFDTLYDRAFVRPVLALAQAVRRVDDDGLDGAVRGSGTAARALGAGVRATQTGNVQSYLTGLLVGVVLLAIAGALVVT